MKSIYQFIKMSYSDYTRSACDMSYKLSRGSSRLSTNKKKTSEKSNITTQEQLNEQNIQYLYLKIIYFAQQKYITKMRTINLDKTNTHVVEVDLVSDMAMEKIISQEPTVISIVIDKIRAFCKENKYTLATWTDANLGLRPYIVSITFTVPENATETK